MLDSTKRMHKPHILSEVKITLTQHTEVEGFIFLAARIPDSQRTEETELVHDDSFSLKQLHKQTNKISGNEGKSKICF